MTIIETITTFIYSLDFKSICIACAGVLSIKYGIQGTQSLKAAYTELKPVYTDLKTLYTDLETYLAQENLSESIATLKTYIETICGNMTLEEFLAIVTYVKELKAKGTITAEGYAAIGQKCYNAIKD